VSPEHSTSYVISPSRPRFVKTARDPSRRTYLAREAAVYDVVMARCPATAARLPRDVHWDQDVGELQMEALSAANLAQRVDSAHLLDTAVAAAVGRAVGEFHAEAADAASDAPPSVWLRGGVHVDRPGTAHLRRFSAGGLKLFETLQRSDGLQSQLAGIAPARGDQLIHGDLRWENVLLSREAAPRVWLVDWELGGGGEHSWDVACFAAAAVSAALWSMPFVPGVPLDDLAAAATIRIEQIAPWLTFFWSAYQAATPDVGTDSLAERIAQLAAVRLVHLGFESTAHDLGVSALAVAHLQVAANILRDPHRAGFDLLGLS
jgi:tRNA A-37 threonylcarbamoyl transferase component Bud32